MKKKLAFLMGTLLGCSCVLSGCKFGDNSSEGQDSSTASETSAATINILDSALLMDCFDSRSLEVELENTEGVTWSSSDPSILSVDANGNLTTNIKEGKVTITAKSGEVSDTCDVTVMVQGNPPTISMQNSMVVSVGGSYSSNIYAYYNGHDITDYVTFDVNAEGDAENYASVSLDGNQVICEGVSVTNEGAPAKFAVYTTVFGSLYAESLSVNVRNTDLSYVVSGNSDKGLLLTAGSSAYTSDVSVFYQGKKVEDSQLEWSIRDESIATIGADGRLNMGMEGETQMVATYKGSLVVINVEVLKLREYVTVVQEKAPYINCDTTVVANLITYPNVGERTLVVNESNEAPLTLPGNVEGGKVVAASVDGLRLPANCFDYAEGVVTIRTKAFGVDCYGEKTLTLFVEGVDTIYEYTLKAIIVTRAIYNLSDFKNTISLGWQGDRIFGYYTLGMDIDCNGCPNGIGTYSTNWNYMDGFRATLDGAGYKLINVHTCNYGITGQIGEGAVLKNLIFEGVYHNGGTAGLFSRGAKNATFENITITSFQSSAKFTVNTDSNDLGGLLVPHQVLGCTFKDITIHAEGFDVESLIGGKGSDLNVLPNTYINVVLYSKTVKYFNYGSKKCPDGITWTKA